MKRIRHRTGINIRAAILMFILVLFIRLNGFAQNFELAGFKFATYPKTSVQDLSSDVKFSFLEYNAFINIPTQLKNKKTVLINGIDYVWVQSSIHDVPDQFANEGGELFHALSYLLEVKHDFREKWSILGTLQPTLSGDFESEINEETFIFLGAALGKYRINEFWSIGAGAAYTMRFGEPTVLPLLLIDYNKGRHRVNSTLPAKFSYTVSLGNKEGIRIGLLYMTNGGQFQMSNTEVYNASEIEKLSYSRANVSVNLTYRIINIIELSAGMGVSNRRQYRLFDNSGNINNFDLNQSSFLYLGIAVVPKKK